MLTVTLVDNHDAVRVGVAHAIAGAGYRCTGAHADVRPILALERAPDVVVLDLYLGRDDQLSTPAIPELVARGSKVVLFTAEERPVPLRRAVSAGAAGLSLKNDGTPALLQVVEGVVSGEFVCSSVLANALVTDDRLLARLTDREVEILRSLDDGLTQHQVARRLAIHQETVKSHLKSVRSKYLRLGRNVTNASTFLREATSDGWVR